MSGDANTDHDNLAAAKTGVVGRAISVKGSQCIIGLTEMRGERSGEPGVTVGKSLGIKHGSSLLVPLLAIKSRATSIAALASRFYDQSSRNKQQVLV